VGDVTESELVLACIGGACGPEAGGLCGEVMPMGWTGEWNGGELG
jgi:hypothetical protein